MLENKSKAVEQQLENSGNGCFSAFIFFSSFTVVLQLYYCFLAFCSSALLLFYRFVVVLQLYYCSSNKDGKKQ
jgi:hypothetical protein